MSASPFDATAQGYDLEFSLTKVGQMQRAITHAGYQRVVALTGNTPRHLLELNCGTGLDAAYFASQGIHVLATDLSAEMVRVASLRLAHTQVELKQQGIQGIGTALQGQQFDMAWSNFGGLNCLSPQEIQASAAEIGKLLPTGGHWVAVVMGRRCIWETLYFLAKFKPRTAFRRLAKGPVAARLADGHTQDTWYYSPREFAQLLGQQWKPVLLMPVGFFLPPSYLEPFFAKRPRLLARLNRWEQAISKRAWPAAFSDHYLMAFERQ